MGKVTKKATKAVKPTALAAKTKKGAAKAKAKPPPEPVAESSSDDSSDDSSSDEEDVAPARRRVDTGGRLASATVRLARSQTPRLMNVAPEPVGLDLSQSGSDGRLSPSSLMDRANRSAGSARSGRSSPSSLTRLFHRRKAAPSMDASGSTRAVERSTLDSSGRGLVIDPPARGRREGDQLDRSNELDRSNASCKLM